MITFLTWLVRVGTRLYARPARTGSVPPPSPPAARLLHALTWPTVRVTATYGRDSGVRGNGLVRGGLARRLGCCKETGVPTGGVLNAAAA
jgi:hypothetical protein